MANSLSEPGPLISISLVILLSVLVSVSTLYVAEFGMAYLFFWVLLLTILGVSLLTEVYSEAYEHFSDSDETNGENTNNKIDDENDKLREFVYLDSLSIQSLLASMEFGTPESVRQLSEQSHTEQEQIAASANIGSSAVGDISGEVNVSNSETGKEVLETKKRISDQHRFKHLYTKLADRNEIDCFPSDWKNDPEEYNLNSNVDIIEFSGTVKTDPLYRMMNVISLITRSISLFTPYLDFDNPENIENFDQETVEDVREAVYGNQIGLKVDVLDSDINYVMALDEDNLWIDNPRREFSESKDYTVLGRVIGVVGENEDWDYIDVFRVTGTVLGEDSMSTIRNVISDFIRMIDGFEKEVPIPDFSEMDVEDISQDTPENFSRHTVDIDIDDKDMSVEGPAIIVDPIAVYW